MRSTSGLALLLVRGPDQCPSAPEEILDRALQSLFEGLQVLGLLPECRFVGEVASVGLPALLRIGINVEGCRGRGPGLQNCPNLIPTVAKPRDRLIQGPEIPQFVDEHDLAQDVNLHDVGDQPTKHANLRLSDCAGSGCRPRADSQAKQTSSC